MIKDKHNLSIVNYVLIYQVEDFGFGFKRVYYPAHLNTLIEFHRRNKDIIDPASIECVTDGTEGDIMVKHEALRINIQVFKRPDFMMYYYYIWHGGNSFYSIEDLTEHLREYFS